jgi:hypothetical protein
MLTKILGLIGSLSAALALAGAAHGGISFGVSEDRGKIDPNFFPTLHDVGLNENRVSLAWDPAAPNQIPDQDALAQMLPMAQAQGVRVVFAVAAKHPRDLLTGAAIGQFGAWVQHVAQTFPQVKDYVIGNEPNQPYFWQPQFDGAGTPIAGAAYEPVLAQSYDALKAVDPTINVIGVGLSPRGNDNPHARTNASRSPVRFLRDLGAAYRASHRTRPLMDTLAFHPYPARNTDPPETGYIWPNAGLTNLDRVKQAVWDAFNGTAQPTFAEGARRGRQPFSPALQLDLDEVGWQVAVLPPLAGLYFGTETQPTIDEATQALYYDQTIRLVACDPSVTSLSFFLLVDEPNLARWQSGLERVDGSHRPSYDTVKHTIAQTQGNCDSTPLRWTHTSRVVAAFAQWGNLYRVKRPTWRRWSFVAAAREEAMFRAGIFRAGTSRSRVVRSLSRGRPRPVLRASGTVKAKSRVIAFPSRRLARGRYFYAIRLQATMNPRRTSLFVSPVFRVGTRRR